MVTLMEIAACIAAIAAAGMFVAGEYRKARNTRRCNDALRRTLCAAFGN